MKQITKFWSPELVLQFNNFTTTKNIICVPKITFYATLVVSNSRPRQWALPPHCECIICALPPPTLAGWRLASLQSSRAVPSLHTYLGIPAHLIEFNPFFLHQFVVNIFARKNRARMLTTSSIERQLTLPARQLWLVLQSGRILGTLASIPLLLELFSFSPMLPFSYPWAQTVLPFQILRYVRQCCYLNPQVVSQNGGLCVGARGLQVQRHQQRWGENDKLLNF